MKFLFKTTLVIVILSMSIMTSCSHPDKDFKVSLIQKSTDKYIDATELTTLEEQLSKAMTKSRTGINFGVDIIKDNESLINYLTEKRGCTIEGLKPAREVKFDDFYVLIENSVSMQGYFGKGNPDFAEPIIALLQCGAQTNHTAYVGTKGYNDPTIDIKEIPQDKFLQDIVQGRFIASAASPIDKMIIAAVDKIIDVDSDSQSIADGVVVNNVFCLISDGLLSGTNSEIASNREFTKNSLPVLENRIRDAVKKAAQYGLQCLVYRLESPFEGTYYDYRNGRHELLGTSRPYYMILIGDQENLERIDNNLKKETNFTKHPSQRFASYDVTSAKTLTKATIAQVPGQTAIIASGNTVKYNPVKLNPDPVVFTVKMQMKSLPAYYLDVESLRNDLSLTYYDKPSNTDVLIPVESWLGDIKVDEDTQAYTFTVCIDNDYLKRMSAEKTSISIKLPGHQDEWYKELSASDDSQIAVGEVSTFGLDRFMGGIMKGFGYQDAANIPNAISLDLNLVKSKI